MAFWNSTDHAKYILSEFRTSTVQGAVMTGTTAFASELATVVESVEEDIITHYTMESQTALGTILDMRYHQDAFEYTLDGGFSTRGYINPDGDYVFLRGFDPDPTKCLPTLRQALVRTIAEVANHRLRTSRANTLAVAQSTERGKSVNYSEAVRDQFPRRWNWRLEKFSLNEPASY